MKSRSIHYTVIAIFCIAAYLPIFGGDFMFDDQSLIRDNPYITKLQSLGSYLAQEDGIVDTQDQGRFHTGYYRPLLNITYFFDYKIWGMKACGFRATNLILHLAVCFMLYELLLLAAGARYGQAFWAVLLFALHPVHTESVSIIVARNNILATLFVLASFYSYISWWQERNPVFLGISLIAFAGAVFSKEFGLMTLPVFFLYQRLLTDKRKYLQEAASYLPFIIIAAIYVALRKTVVPATIGLPDDIAMRIAYVPYLLAYNLKLVFLPGNLHSFSVFYPASAYSMVVVLSYLLLFCLAGLLYVKRKETLLVFSVISFAVALIPVLNLVAKASVSLIAMRWLYLPVALLSFGLVAVLMQVQKKRPLSKRLVLMAIALYFAGYSYTLNAHLWRDHETFLRQEVLHFDNDLYLGDYAEILLKKKMYAEAEHLFKRSLQARSKQVYNYINYSALLLETNRPDEAIAVLNEASRLSMIAKDRSGWNNNMGAALALQGKYDEATEYFRKALALNPHNRAVYRNMASLLAVTGRSAEAAEYLKKAESIERSP